MQISSYDESYFSALHRSFNLSFSTNTHTFNLSEEDFLIRIKHKLPINPELSLLLLERDEVIGFLLQSKSNFKEKVICYNAGIGIVPYHRRKGYSHLLILAAIENARTVGVHQMILEVVDTNEAALKLYKGNGFNPTRMLYCFKRPKKTRLNFREDLMISKATDWQVTQYEEMVEFETGFTDSLQELKRNSKHEWTIEAHEDGLLVGFIIFQPRIGRISKLAVRKDRRRKKIGTTLIYHCALESRGKPLTILNIPNEQSGMKGFLEALGFKNEINQIEMIKAIEP